MYFLTPITIVGFFENRDQMCKKFLLAVYSIQSTILGTVRNDSRFFTAIACPPDPHCHPFPRWYGQHYFGILAHKVVNTWETELLIKYIIGTPSKNLVIYLFFLLTASEKVN